MKKLFLQLSAVLITATVFGQANVQVIHNCPTAAADSVDIYFYDGSTWVSSPVISNLKFRHSTDFSNVLPTGNPNMRVAIAPKDATPTIGDTLVSFAIPSLMTGNYVVMAHGEVGSMMTPFTLSLSGGQTTSSVAGQIDLNIFHGSTDAPPVAIFLNDNGTVPAVPNLAYESFTGYVPFSNIDHTILLTLASNINVNVAGYSAPLNTLGLVNGAGVVYASGKLNPGTGEPAFGLYVALPNGGPSLPLPTANLSRIQIAHNSPDPLVSTVDFYAVTSSDTSKIEDVAYRTATNYLIIPSDNYTIHFAPSNSTSVTQSIFNQSVTLAANTNYLAVANGLVNITPPNFADAISVNGTNANFNVTLYTNSKVKADTSGQVDLLVYHQSPDAPTVDVFVQELGANLIDDFSYGEVEGYVNFGVPVDVNLDIRDASGSVVVASYFAPLTALANEAPVVFASGFLTPDNENVASLSSFGLYYITGQGGSFMPLFNVTSIEEVNEMELSLYPNPTSDVLNIQLNTLTEGDVHIMITDMTGRNVKALNVGKINNGQIMLPIYDLKQGQYILTLNDSRQLVKKMFIKK